MTQAGALARHLQRGLERRRLRRRERLRALRVPRRQRDAIDAAALLIPDDVNFPTLDRTRTDVQAVLANYFGFTVPLFVWEYPTE